MVRAAALHAGVTSRILHPDNVGSALSQHTGRLAKRAGEGPPRRVARRGRVVSTTYEGNRLDEKVLGRTRRRRRRPAVQPTPALARLVTLVTQSCASRTRSAISTRFAQSSVDSRRLT